MRLSDASEVACLNSGRDASVQTCTRPGVAGSRLYLVRDLVKKPKSRRAEGAQLLNCDDAEQRKSLEARVFRFLVQTVYYYKIVCTKKHVNTLLSAPLNIPATIRPGNPGKLIV